jgi:hypothetical protein
LKISAPGFVKRAVFDRGSVAYGFAVKDRSLNP